MRKIEIDEFKRFTYPSNLTTFDGGLIFTETTVNMDDNKYEANICVLNKDNKKYQLTSSGKDSLFKVFSDGQVVFISNIDKTEKDLKTHLYKIDPSGGERQKYVTIDLQVNSFEELDKENLLLIGYEAVEKDEFEEIDVLPFWLNGQGFTYNSESSIYIYNLKNNSLEKITDDNLSFNYLKLSEDKKKAIVFYNEKSKVLSLTDKLGILDLETKTLTKLDEGKSFAFADFTDDGIIFLASEMKKHGLNEDNMVYFINNKSEIKQISKDDFDVSFGNSVGTDLRMGANKQGLVYKNSLYYISTDFDHAILSKIDLDGKVEKIINEKGSVDGFDIDKKTGDIYFIAFRGLNLSEIYKLEKGAKKLTNYSKDLEDIELSEIEEFEFTNDGIDFSGYVLKPYGYEKGKKYPGILEIHGGPKTAFSNIIHHEMQWLSSLGYFVFYTNPRGSSGRGVEFSDIRGKYGTIDYDDLMKFTDEVLDRYKDIDKNNLAVMGGSYGGFMTNWVIGHTDRFKVANSQRSISNWTSFYGVSDIGFYFAQDQTDSNPWDNLDKMWEQSPIKYVRNVKTPTLFIHSDQDFRCPLEQGIQMYAGVQLNKVDTKLVIFKGENHELSRSGKPNARKKRLEEIQNFYEKHIEK